ncbi:MAG: NnrS family protein [Opitutales bacterium]|nr:NnrS family protein [Opitutales bacterium]
MLAKTLRLTAAGEPFRLLFPLGWLLGLVGILLWPLYAIQWLEIYPTTAHARVMIQGFLTAFVMGFLGTALPRLLDVPRIRLKATALLAGGIIVVAALHLAQRTFLADLAFLALFASFIGLILSRARHRQDTPPPGFVLVGLGLLSALVGTALFVWTNASPGNYQPTVYTLARLLLYQGYILLPIMGIGAFLLPRFFGLPSRQNFAESLKVTPEWKLRARFAASCGGLVIISFVLEAVGYFHLAHGLRALGVALYFFHEVPVHQAKFSKGSLALALRIALFAIPLGYVLMALMPAYQSGLAHVVFVTGFSLLTFTVASRVLLGHSGQSEKFSQVLKPILWMTGLLTFAMALRVAADFLPSGRIHAYATASVIWAIGTFIWAKALLPSIAREDTE